MNYRDDVFLPVTCSRCGVPGQMRHTQTCTDRGARYSASFSCSSCGLTTEVDGLAPPEEIRRALLKEGGGWQLRLVEVPEELSEFVRALSRLLSVELSVALRLAKRRMEPIASGTHVEMQCLEKQLAVTGACMRVDQTEEVV
jgi:hypothetical protein